MPTKRPLQLSSMQQSANVGGQEYGRSNGSTHLSVPYIRGLLLSTYPCRAPCSKTEEGNHTIIPLVAYLTGQMALCEKILYKASCVSAYIEYQICDKVTRVVDSREFCKHGMFLLQKSLHTTVKMLTCL